MWQRAAVGCYNASVRYGSLVHGPRMENALYFDMRAKTLDIYQMVYGISFINDWNPGHWRGPIAISIDLYGTEK